MNNKLFGSLVTGLANGVLRGMGSIVAGAVVTGVLSAVGIETEGDVLTSNPPNDSDTNSDSLGNNSEA